jgi:hypothetical protein
MRALRLVLLVLAACPPSVDETDRPAAMLTAALVVLDTSAAPSDGKVAVIAELAYNGTVVDAGGNATVSCNGVPLGFGGIGYEGRVPLAASYAFVHTRAGVTSTALVTAAARPVVTAPASGDLVTRTSSLTVRYQAGAGARVRATASDGATAVAGSDQPDTGTYTGVDTSGLRPGAGTVGVTRDIEAVLTGTGFASARSTVTTSSVDVPVTWR